MVTSSVQLRSIPIPPEHAPDREFDAEAVARLAWRALRRLGIPDHALADCVQDTLLVVHRRVKDFRGESNFNTWLYAIVLRVASGFRRSQRRAGRVFEFSASVTPIDPASDDPSPFDRLEQKVATEMLLSVLDELPTEVRDLFVLVELEQLPLAEAAAALDISLSTCKSRLKTGRRLFEAAVARLRARLQYSEVRR